MLLFGAECAAAGFSLICSRLEGEQLPSAMRLLCSLAAGLAGGLILAYCIVCRSSLHRTPTHLKTGCRNLSATGTIEPVGKLTLLATKYESLGSDSSFSRSSSSGGRSSGGRSGRIGGSGGGSSF